jgi:hypothetical protein
LSLAFREEHRLRVFENGAEENIWIEEGWNYGGGGGLHNEELRNFYSSQSVIRMIK